MKEVDVGLLADAERFGRVLDGSKARDASLKPVKRGGNRRWESVGGEERKRKNGQAVRGVARGESA